MEAAALGLFMVSACAFGVLLEHPASPLRQALGDDFTRRALMGLAMGGTAIALIHSPWGKQSGAHMNPAVTLTFLRLGKVARADAAAYITAQFLGGATGVAVMGLLLKPWLADPAVHFVATVPGRWGWTAAFAGEVAISFLLMSVVLFVSNHNRLARFTGVSAGACVALFIAFEAPVSGMSMNPARTLASAWAAQDWTALWIYFIAPLLGMLLAAQVRELATARTACAKLHHANDKRCIFCEFQHEQAMRPRCSSARAHNTMEEHLTTS
jgi:aquaporin Z